MQTTIIFALYRAFQTAAFPFLILYALLRVLRDRRYGAHIGERFGALPVSFQRTVRDSVWLHAVSVGEVLSSVELIRRLRTELPGAPVFVSCATLAGREVAETRLRGLADGVFYAPADYVFAVRRVLRRIRPAVVVILETEIWPNLYRQTKLAGCGLVVVNGRISDAAFPKYRRWAWLFRHVLELPDTILVQSEEQSGRYVASGAPADKVQVAGNLKYDFDPDQAAVSDVLLAWLEAERGPLWVAGSTVRPEFECDVDEDDAVIAAWQSLPGIRLAIAPRKPERFEVVARKLKEARVPFVRRSELPGSDAPVLLLDSIGELGGVFRYADVVFMGGTLAHRGGHNVLEPALFSKPVIAGPHLENFSEIQDKFRRAEALFEISSAARLGGAVSALIENRELAESIGQRGKALAEAERGATSRAVAEIVRVRWNSVPAAVHYGPIRPVLWLLSRLWLAGGYLKRALTKTEGLSHPVISIGGIAMGGAGKTPVVRYLVRALHAGGLRPAILTRGYRREQPERVTVLKAGESAPVSVTGDEAQSLLRDGFAHLGIGRDRYAAGRLLEQQLDPDIFVLDDGFQHSRLHRDIDVVVLDGLDPFGGGGVFPLGFLREEIESLRRTHLIVITRAENRQFDGVVERIRRVNPQAPIVLCRTRVVPFESIDIKGTKVGAFCGIGNPEAFRRTLQEMGCEIVYWKSFGDHHRYSRGDIESMERAALANGASVLLTTEKDSVRVPPDARSSISIYSLIIDLEVTDLCQ